MSVIRIPRRRVVITGLGPISAFGVGIEPLWNAMIAGKTAIKTITSMDASGFPCSAGAQLPADAFDVRSVVPKSYRKATKVMARDIELAVGAADAAVRDAKLITKAINPDVEPTIPASRFGCHIGAGLIAAEVDELTAALASSRPESFQRSAISSRPSTDSRQPIANSLSPCPIDLAHWGSAGMQNLTPLWLLKYLPNMLACHVTIIHDCRGPSNTITCAEASCALSVGESVRVIQRNAADACLSGGAECKLNTMGILRQTFSRRLAPTNGSDGSTIVKPFDAHATGSVLGEGGGIIVVEAFDTALARGATLYAEITGFAATQSFCPDTVGLELDPDDESLGDAMDMAMRNAGVKPEEIDAIAPFGSGIPNIDQAEIAAIKRVFGPRAADIPIITTIPNTGNCCAGVGAITLAVAAKAMHAQMLPARLNTTNAQGLCANAAPAKAAPLRNILVTSTGIGGQNVAIVLRRVGS